MPTPTSEVWVATEEWWKDGSEVLGVATTVEDAKVIAEAHLDEDDAADTVGVWKRNGEGWLLTVDDYTVFEVEPYPMLGGT